MNVYIYVCVRVCVCVFILGKGIEHFWISEKLGFMIHLPLIL